jgi:hypothetical protein
VDTKECEVADICKTTQFNIAIHKEYIMLGLMLAKVFSANKKVCKETLILYVRTFSLYYLTGIVGLCLSDKVKKSIS